MRPDGPSAAAARRDPRRGTFLRGAVRAVRRHGWRWAAWQAALSLGSAWLIGSLGVRAVRWAAGEADWAAVGDNLRLFAVGAWPLGQVGGLALTLLLTVASIVLAFPLGVLLALGRRSPLPLARGVSVGVIELVRGVPLVTVLYMVALVVPLLLPGGLRPSDFARAVAGLAVFTAAYIAEDVRGGLAAVGGGQYEAARALGLSTAQVYRRVILPQALRVAIPALAGQFISLFKNTALVIILGLRELVGIARAVANQPEHLGAYRETYAFAAAVFLVLSFGLSRASRRLEVRHTA